MIPRRSLTLLLALGLGWIASGVRAAPAPGGPAIPPCASCRDSFARANGMVPLVGRLTRSGAGWTLEGCAGTTALTGTPPAPLVALEGRQVFVNTLCRDGTSGIAMGGHAMGDSVVDLFVESMCPFARALEGRMAERILGPDSLLVPPVRLHFLLFLGDSAGSPRVSSLHGERELEEDAVQIVLRQDHPTLMWHYLAERSHSDADWRVVAQKAGLSWRDITAIERRVEQESRALLHAEITEVSNDWPTIDGSPTPYWLGDEVKNLDAVPGLRKAAPAGGHCPH